MVLELILIGGLIYWGVKKSKQKKAMKAAFLAGEPYILKDGSVLYPPGHPGLPPAYAAHGTGASYYGCRKTPMSMQPPTQFERGVETQQKPYSDVVSVPVQGGDEWIMTEKEEVVKGKY